jgi:predicted lipoprotein
MAASAWIKHVMKYAKENNIKFGEALKKAGPSYKSQEPSVSEKKTRKTRRNKGKKRGKTLRKK